MNQYLRPALLAVVLLPASVQAALVNFTYTQTDALTGSGTISGTIDASILGGPAALAMSAPMPAAAIASAYTPPPAVPAGAVGGIDALSGLGGGNGVHLGWGGLATLTGVDGPTTYEIDVALQQVNGATYSWNIVYADDLVNGFDLVGNIRAAAYIGNLGSGHRHTDFTNDYVTYSAGVEDVVTYANTVPVGPDADGDNLGIEAGLREGTLTSGEITVDEITYSGPLTAIDATLRIAGGPPPPPPTIVAFEAESGVNLGGAMAWLTDPNASNEEYIETTNNAYSDPPPANTITTYGVSLPGGLYDLYARLLVEDASGGNDDSLLVLGDLLTDPFTAGAGSWYTQNNLFHEAPDGSYFWVKLTGRTDGSEALPTYLGDGTFAIGGREDGLRIDAFAFAPTGVPVTDEQLDAALLAAIPEPCTLALLGAGLIAMARRRRRG